MYFQITKQQQKNNKNKNKNKNKKKELNHKKKTSHMKQEITLKNTNKYIFEPAKANQPKRI